MEIDLLPKDPFKLFRLWYQEYQNTKPKDSTIMTLATSDTKGRPSARVVLMKSFEEKGFTFFTNYESRKSQDILANPFGQLLFFWEPLGRQVRVFGGLSKVSEKESDDYFKTRPYLSQIGAWASNQSRKIGSRKELADRFEEYKNKYPEGAVPRPPHWGGWLLKPEEFEFWIGRENRLHDRFHYFRGSDPSSWNISRLAP